MELGNTEHKIVRLHKVELKGDNVVTLFHNAELTVVELENIVELGGTADEGQGACENGVCSVSWKPRRPTAA